MSDNYYAVLGLDSSASTKEIQKEINKRIRVVQARQYSSDAAIVARAVEAIKELKAMRTLLLDTDRRREYDGTLSIEKVTDAVQSATPELTADDFFSISGGSQVSTGVGYSIALVMDTSGSMYGQSLGDAKTAMRCFLDELAGVDNRVALVSFGCRTGVICPLSKELGEIRDGIDSLTAENGTPLLRALHSVGNDIFPESATESMIVIATDGHPNESQSEILSYASTLKNRDIRIIVIGIGASVPVEFLKQLASSEEDYFFAKASVELKKIYKNISDGLIRLK